MEATAGLGFKTEHLEDALMTQARGLWFEVHAENYMMEGGPRLAALDALAARFPISLHGVGLSLASTEPPSQAHLTRLRHLSDRIRPWAISDHLAWQRWNGAHHADFLPFPRTREALAIAVYNVDLVQDALGREILVENPSLYVDLPGHELSEADFLSELAEQTGCRLLVDINNVFVSAANLGFSARSRLAAIPAELIGEIHLAGHSRDSAPESPLLIDSHDAPVAEAVWRLFQELVERTGPRPTLIERDDNVPAFDTLMLERGAAHAILREAERHRV